MTPAEARRIVYGPPSTDALWTVAWALGPLWFWDF